jgi:hypothetical protein
MATLNAKLLEAKLRELHGNMAACARHFGTTRQAVHRYVSKRPALQAVVLECRESMKDHAESALYNAVFKGESWAVRYYLSCQAKDRGYVLRQEVNTTVDVKQIDAAIEAELNRLATGRGQTPDEYREDRLNELLDTARQRQEKAAGDEKLPISDVSLPEPPGPRDTSFVPDNLDDFLKD